MKINILVFCFLVISCSEFDYEEEYFIIPELKVYVDNFYKEAAAHNSFPRRYSLGVRINDLSKWRALGMCWNHDKTVLIDDNFYQDRANEYSLELEAVVFHELGHALLGREHSNDLNSLMNKYYNRTKYVRDPEYRRTQLNELFQ